jgi:hypothetical protein
MTTAAVSVRRRPARFRRVSPAAAGRLLRLELRRNVTPWLLWPLAALSWFAGPYRVPMEYGPFWEQRALVMLDHFAPLLAFAAGAAAWMGSREGRRRITDQVLTTPRPGWARRLATLAATACWLLLGYLALVAARSCRGRPVRAADAGVFYRYPPVAALGALGLPAASAGPRLRVAAAVVTTAGLAAAGLAGSAVQGANGMVITSEQCRLRYPRNVANPSPYADVQGRQEMTIFTLHSTRTDNWGVSGQEMTESREKMEFVI